MCAPILEVALYGGFDLNHFAGKIIHKKNSENIHFFLIYSPPFQTVPFS